MKFKHIGSILRWGTIVATLIFIGKAFSDNWQEVKNIQINHGSCIYLTLALGISLLSHSWSGVVWGEILRNLKYPVPWSWAMTTFIITEPAKYLPGDIWQVYGRLKSGKKIGVPIEIGIVSVVLQSVYIAAAGLGFGILASKDLFLTGSCLLGLVFIAFCIHPYFFAKFISLIEKPLHTKILSRFNLKQAQRPQMRSYPLKPIAGQFLFLGLRSISFILTVLALSPISKDTIVPIIGSFSFAWALGIVSPISGGVGVFEATALSMLDKAIGSSYILGAIILYRLIALMTEVIGAGLGWLIKKSIEQPIRN
jgi:glycosyltransferase 2 family protein